MQFQTATLIFLFIALQYLASITSTWPHLRCHVGLEEEEY